MKDGLMMLMMGTKDEDMPAQPVEKTKFVEDMDERELSRAMDMPAGLQNLGNTCYLNATVQCLKSVPELRTALTNYSGSVSLGGGQDAVNMTAALRDLYSTMDKGSTIPPIILLQVLHMAFPRFAERGENGGYQQQDANECWVEVLRMLQAKTSALKHPPREMQLISSWVLSAAVKLNVMKLQRRLLLSQWKNSFSFHVTLTRMSNIFTQD